MEFNPTLQDFSKELATLLLDGQKRTVRIFGNGGSGKSTFAKELINLMGENQVTLLETDPYIIKGDYRSQVVPTAASDQKVTACMPAAHELNSLDRDIRALQAGFPLLTIDEPWSPSCAIRHDKSLLLIEGMSVGFLPKELFDLSICLATDDALELARRLERDVTQRGRHPEFVKQIQASRRQQYRTYYQPLETAADILIYQTLAETQINKRSCN